MRVLIWAGVLFLSSIPASALPLESADPFSFSNDPHILTLMPPEQFSVDDRLKKNVEFWVRVYTQYYTYQGLIHDAKYIDHIYEVIDFHQIPNVDREQYVKAEKKKWKEILLSIRKKRNDPGSMSSEERRIYEMFSDVNEPDKFLNAAHRRRLRFQLGQKDQFLEGLKASGRYLPMMEEIFRQEGVPVELTRLPFVESSFNLRARSKVGASGIWQFMRSTGRLFLKVNDAVDERNDPIRATEAAAKLLKMNYDSLKNWPLAVTAYNHGRKGMMRAVRRVGSDELEELVSAYHSRSFGFASGNFFTELLAAVEVEKNADKYFGKIERLQPDSFYEVKIPDYIDIRELAVFLKLDMQKIKYLNPALLDTVYGGQRLIPSGYFLRLPHDSKLDKQAEVRIFLAGYSQIPDLYKLRAQRGRRYGRRLRARRAR